MTHEHSKPLALSVIKAASPVPPPPPPPPLPPPFTAAFAAWRRREDGVAEAGSEAC